LIPSKKGLIFDIGEERKSDREALWIDYFYGFSTKSDDNVSFGF